MAENIDFLFPLKKACTSDIGRYCKGIPHGHARVIRCLQDHIDASEFEPGCKAEIQAHEQFVGADYRCAGTVAGGAGPCGWIT